MTQVVVIDGQGGRLGGQVIEKMIAAGLDADVTAVGTNSIATAAMLKAGAPRGATGENAVCVNSRRADVIIGPVGIVVADALLGEITPEMAAAVGRSDAVKLLIPVNQCSSIIVGTADMPMAALVTRTVEMLKEIIE